MKRNKMQLSNKGQISSAGNSGNSGLVQGEEKFEKPAIWQWMRTRNASFSGTIWAPGNRQKISDGWWYLVGERSIWLMNSKNPTFRKKTENIQKFVISLRIHWQKLGKDDFSKKNVRIWSFPWGFTDTAQIIVRNSEKARKLAFPWGITDKS